MGRKNLNASLILSILLFVSLLHLLTQMQVGSFILQEVRASTTTVSVVPSSVTAYVGQNFSIDIAISDVLDLYGWEFKLSWNASLLDVVNVTEGTFLKNGGSTFWYYKVNETDGRLVADCTLLGDVQGVSGSGVLATITFNVLDVGNCSLDLYEVTLLDSSEQLIACQVIDGYGSFRAPHDIALVDISFSPNVVLPGDIVNINVTVENQGAYNESFNVSVYVDSTKIGEKSVSLNENLAVTLQFEWNTTNFDKGDYEISASADPVKDEIETADNSMTANGTVTILYPGHDISILNVASIKSVVGQGYSTDITVSVKNYGIYSETFNVTVYVNASIIGTEEVTLSSATLATLTFIWNTTGFDKGNYTTSAYAQPVPNEVEIADNEKSGETVYVGLPGDINADGGVYIDDIAAIAQVFGAESGFPSYKPECDITNDGQILIDDVSIAARNFGKTDP